MTKGRADINKSELPQLIKNIEANGGDASALRAIMVVDRKPETPGEITDDELVDYNRSLSTIRQGDGLICAICRQPSPILTNDTCDDCFRMWTLSCKAAILKVRSRYGNANSS